MCCLFEGTASGWNLMHAMNLRAAARLVGRPGIQFDIGHLLLDFIG